MTAELLTRALCLAAVSLFGPAAAQAADTALPNDIIVTARSSPQIGIATSASSGAISQADLANHAIARAGELAENVPGLIATQHSGTGKANQYFLRGFNLDHGTDLAGFVDGAPINLRTHGHGQGYLDLNFLIPELIERIEYRKGPYWGGTGDFGVVGTIGFNTADRLDAPIAEATAGSFGYARAVAAGDTALGNGRLLGAIEAVRGDGPWLLDERLRKANGLIKWSEGSVGASSSVTLGLYHSTWNSTDQIPERAVSTGLIDRRGFIDPYLGGKTIRASATANLTRGDWRGTLYAIFSDLKLTSNFTYFLDDPIDGDEFRQRDRRGVFGGSVRHDSYGGIVGAPAALTLGADVRYDAIGKVGLYHTKAGRILSTVREDRVGEASAAAFADLQLWLLPNLRLLAGLRGDLYRYDVTSDLAVNSGQGWAALLTPKAGIAWQVAEPLELYANYGEGFHSNDARGATIRVDPASGVPAEPIDLLVRARSAEIGLRYERGSLRVSATAFRLGLASELVFAGDSGSTEAGPASRRTGVETTLYWRPALWLTLDAAAAFTHARFRHVAAGQDRIPNAVPRVISAGAAIEPASDWTITLRLRHFGAAPLIEDGSARSRQTSLVNLGTQWHRGDWRIGVDLFNLFDARANDITHYYASRLQGEPSDGVEDRHIHPVEPRQLRVSLRRAF